MSLLWVFYREHVQKVQLSELPPSQPITIGPDMKDTITVGTLPLRQTPQPFIGKKQIVMMFSWEITVPAN